MGLYDCRCMVTGVSLKGADAVLVLLEGADSTFLPAALGIKGNYNRGGGIDLIEEDENVSLVEAYFRQKLRSGEFVVKDYYLGGESYSEKYSAEWFLWVLERNINDDPEAAVLYGQPLVFALVCKAVWNSIARSAAPLDDSDEEVFRRLFDGRSVPSDIYGGTISAVRPQLLGASCPQ